VFFGEGKSIPKGLKPRFVDGLERPKAKALGYLEAMARVTGTARTEADPLRG
jgi:hypothetical protein